MDIDKPLDDIIKTKRASKAATRGGGRGGKAPASARDRYAGNAPKSARGNAGPQQARPAGPQGGNNKAGVPAGLAAEATKIIISNLPLDVNEAAVRDLLQSTVGPVRSVQMSYTATGKSSGTATVIFKNKGDANKAHSAYHNRMIDNQRPMKVELALDMNQLHSLASRVAPAPVAKQAPRAAKPQGRAARPKKERAAPKTAEELDAEMNAYKESTA